MLIRCMHGRDCATCIPNAQCPNVHSVPLLLQGSSDDLNADLGGMCRVNLDWVNKVARTPKWTWVPVTLLPMLSELRLCIDA